eukprot:14353473-Alexandrium_andersonii.AAC.1
MSSQGAATSPGSSLRPRAISPATAPTSPRPAECAGCVRPPARALLQLLSHSQMSSIGRVSM